LFQILKTGTMANKSIPMVQIRRILQLLIAGSSIRQISKVLNLHRKTIDGYLIKFDSTQKSYTELLALEDFTLNQLINLPTLLEAPDNRYTELLPMFGYFIQELKRTGVTRGLLWQEYRQQYPQGYSYSQFCEHLQQYSQRLKATMHFTHKQVPFFK
jgi:hypothetical protein